MRDQIEKQQSELLEALEKVTDKEEMMSILNQRLILKELFRKGGDDEAKD